MSFCDFSPHCHKIAILRTWDSECLKRQEQPQFLKSFLPWYNVLKGSDLCSPPQIKWQALLPISVYLSASHLILINFPKSMYNHSTCYTFIYLNLHCSLYWNVSLMRRALVWFPALFPMLRTISDDHHFKNTCWMKA